MMNLSKKNLHVCFILPIPLFPLKGSSFTCFRQATALKNRGLKVTILASRIASHAEKDRYNDLKHSGIKLLGWLPYQDGPKYIKHLTSLFFSWPFIVAAIVKEKPDIIHVHNPTDIIPMIASLINRFFKIPYVFQINDPGPESILSLTKLKPIEKTMIFRLSKLFENIVNSHASGFITVNEVLKEKIIQTRNNISNKPFAVYYHVSKPLNDNMTLKELDNLKYILYVGTLSTEILGLEELIKLYSKIWCKYGVKLLIIGDGPLKSKLAQTIKSLCSEEYVKLLGYIEPKYIHEYLNHAKLCVIPYLDTILTRVSTPTKLFEYISMGKAVVYPNFPGFTEILGNGNPGMYLSSVPGDIMQVIENLLCDDELRKKTESINKRHSINFDADTQIERIVNLYREIIRDTEK